MITRKFCILSQSMENRNKCAAFAKFNLFHSNFIYDADADVDVDADVDADAVSFKAFTHPSIYSRILMVCSSVKRQRLS